MLALSSSFATSSSPRHCFTDQKASTPFKNTTNQRSNVPSHLQSGFFNTEKKQLGYGGKQTVRFSELSYHENMQSENRECKSYRPYSESKFSAKMTASNKKERKGEDTATKSKAISKEKQRAQVQQQ
jgi:hypothetical protein